MHLATAAVGRPLAREYSLAHLLARPEVAYERLMTLPGVGPGVSDPVIVRQLEVQAKYAGYIGRQSDEIARLRAQEGVSLPPDLDYGAVRGLSSEVREKLELHRPATLGQASRVAGVTPAAISLLRVHLKRRGAESAFPRAESV